MKTSGIDTDEVVWDFVIKIGGSLDRTIPAHPVNNKPSRRMFMPRLNQVKGILLKSLIDVWVVVVKRLEGVKVTHFFHFLFGASSITI